MNGGDGWVNDKAVPLLSGAPPQVRERDGMTLKTIDGSEQGTHCVWFDNRGPVRHGGGD
jgi:hypothetical protein